MNQVLYVLQVDLQSLQQVSSKGVPGPGGVDVRVRVRSQVLAGGCGRQGPHLLMHTHTGCGISYINIYIYYL